MTDKEVELVVRTVLEVLAQDGEEMLAEVMSEQELDEFLQEEDNCDCCEEIAAKIDELCSRVEFLERKLDNHQHVKAGDRFNDFFKDWGGNHNIKIVWSDGGTGGSTNKANFTN